VSRDREIVEGECTDPPTQLPTTNEPTVTPMPSASNAPTTTPTSSLSPFRGVQSAILRRENETILATGTIQFERRLDITSTTVQIVVRQGAVFDGDPTTSLLKLENTNLTLESVTLQNGYGAIGGCVYVSKDSHLILVRVLTVACVGVVGGSFYLQSSSLFAFDL